MLHISIDPKTNIPTVFTDDNPNNVFNEIVAALIMFITKTKQYQPNVDIDIILNAFITAVKKNCEKTSIIDIPPKIYKKWKEDGKI